MLGRRRKLNAKLEKNQLFLPGFPATKPLFFFFSPPWPLVATTDLTTILYLKQRIPSITQQPHRSLQRLPLSPSLFCKTSLSLHHRNPSSSSNSNHPFQRLVLLSAAAWEASPPSATPTAPAVSFPSPLQGLFPSSSSQDQCTPPASPPPASPRATSRATDSLHAR